MPKHILLPTDFSDNAWSAAVYALKLYANEDCTFHFLNSTKLRLSTMSNLSNKLLATIAENTMKELVALKDMAQTANANANHTFEVILSNEDLQEAIETAVIKHSINLVVMGTKGATAAKEFFFGSNTVRTIKKLTLCSILVVPDEFNFVEPEQIAFPTDFSRFYDTELIPLKSLTKLYNSKIRILHINDEKNLSELQNYNLAMLKAYLEDYPHSFHWLPDYDKKSEEINDFIKELDINILAMVNYKHSFIERIANEPVIKKLGFHPIVPFLVIPA
jgi:nucleotide-binding universal stress UspA family protein